MHFINRRFTYLLTLLLYYPQPPVSCKACNYVSYAVVVQCDMCCIRTELQRHDGGS